jgi:hypothetical protein
VGGKPKVAEFSGKHGEQALRHLRPANRNNILIFCTFFLPSQVEFSRVLISYTANERPLRFQYKCLVPIDVFPEMKLLVPKQNYNVLSPSSYTHISVRDYIFPGSVCLFCCREIGVPILGIHKSLTDT